MLTEVTYRILNVKGLGDYTLEVINKKNGESCEVVFKCRGNFPNKVGVFDELFRNAMIGKMGFDEFHDSNKEYNNKRRNKKYHDYCVELDEKMSGLFGDYELTWFLGYEDEII